MVTQTTDSETPRPDSPLTEAQLVNVLADVLCEDVDETNVHGPIRAETFEDAGILTRTNGLVLTMGDGSVFEITVVKTRDAQVKCEACGADLDSATAVCEECDHDSTHVCDDNCRSNGCRN